MKEMVLSIVTAVTGSRRRAGQGKQGGVMFLDFDNVDSSDKGISSTSCEHEQNVNSIQTCS